MRGNTKCGDLGIKFEQAVRFGDMRTKVLYLYGREYLRASVYVQVIDPVLKEMILSIQDRSLSYVKGELFAYLRQLRDAHSLRFVYELIVFEEQIKESISKVNIKASLFRCPTGRGECECFTYEYGYFYLSESKKLLPSRGRRQKISL